MTVAEKVLYCVQTVEGTSGEGPCFGLLRSFLPLLERLGDSGELSEVPEAKFVSACSPAVTRDSHLSCLLKGSRSRVRTEERTRSEQLIGVDPSAPMALCERLRPLIASNSAANALSVTALTDELHFSESRGRANGNLGSPMPVPCGAACPQNFDK